MASFLKRDLAASKRFKAKLKRKDVATLIHSSHPSPSLVERLGQYGFDCVLLDAEHGSVGRDRVEEMSRAAALADVASIIRPEGSLPHLITGYLACGVDGFMLPLIQSVEQAQELVDTFRFSAPADYEDRVMVLMIERIEAVDCLPDLLKLDHVDAFMIAQTDLALTMGEAFRPLSPKVEAVIDRAIATIVDAGKTCGVRVDYDNAEAYLEKGATLLYDHADHMLNRGSKDFLAKIAAASPGAGTVQAAVA